MARNTVPDKPLRDLKWGVERRMEFIEFRLFWEGKINRIDLIDHFGVSTPQASADFNLYQELAPGNLLYDTRAKHYFPSEKFQARFLKPDSEYYLANLHAMSTGILTAQESWLSHIPQFDVLPALRRTIQPELLQTILEAIRKKQTLRIRYQSMQSPEPVLRWVTPRALAHDGYRWHIRAFCHLSSLHKDYLFPRIIKVEAVKQDDQNLPPDHEWEQTVTVQLGPHPDLTETQKKAVELDFGMKNGKLEARIRVGFLYYFLNRWGLDPHQIARKTKYQQIILLNNQEILQYYHRPRESVCGE
ncbi:MAG: WYL domain-containing protein [Magnetococcales bacterium]|nr:WYL domain-containing protein [Magnetococcales bacterium]